MVFSEDGMVKLRCDIGQRPENKPSFFNTGMGQGKIICPYDLLSKVEEIEIQGPGAIPSGCNPFTSGRFLDLEEALQ